MLIPDATPPERDAIPNDLGADADPETASASATDKATLALVPFIEPIRALVPFVEPRRALVAFVKQDRVLQTFETRSVYASTTIEPGDISFRQNNSLSYGTMPTISPLLRKKMLRYVRKSLRHRRRPSVLSTFSLLLLALILFGIIAPLTLTAGYSLQAYSAYQSLSSHATSGIQHLTDIKTLFSTKSSPSSGTAGLLDATKLQRAEQDLLVAHGDFVALQQTLTDTQLIQTLTQVYPRAQPVVTTARSASQIGIDLTAIGLQLLPIARSFAPRLHGSLLSNTGTPLITSIDIAHIRVALDNIQPSIADIQLQARSLDLNTLPISQHTIAQLTQYLQLLPQAVTTFNMLRSLLDPISWLLGVGQPRTFLVQTMDRAELRATGGFTGQYGEVQINAGRVTPPALRNIALLEYSTTTTTTAQLAPEPYRSWWPFPNWGLRDANLSGDFPTSANIEMSQYKAEVGHSVDGVIMFTPFLIENVLKATGPITVPVYNETITAQNLEAKLHFYQLDHDGIVKEKAIEHVTADEDARKQFTARLTKTLIAQVGRSSSTTLLALAQEMLHSMQTHDLEVYLANPQLENLLTQNHYASQIDTSASRDGLAIVQANLNATKASQYVRTSVHDTIDLDNAGGATHTLQMNLAYTQIGDVYGLDTYRDYVRIYVPTSARLLYANGFDTGTPVCGGALGDCSANGPYADSSLICPTGQYHGGAYSNTLDDPYYGQYHPLDSHGGPTNLTSDISGRNMYAGWLVVPKNCSLTLTLSWYVPPISSNNYQFLYQHQAGTVPDLNVTILPPPASCGSFSPAGIYFAATINRDELFSLKRTRDSASAQHACSVQPGV